MTMLAWATLGPLTGHLSERFGPRIVEAPCGVMMGSGLVLYLRALPLLCGDRLDDQNFRELRAARRKAGLCRQSGRRDAFALPSLNFPFADFVLFVLIVSTI